MQPRAPEVLTATRIKRAGPQDRSPGARPYDVADAVVVPVSVSRQLSSSSMRKPRIGDGAWPIGDGPCGRTGAIGWVIAGDICC